MCWLICPRLARAVGANGARSEPTLPCLPARNFSSKIRAKRRLYTALGASGGDVLELAGQLAFPGERMRDDRVEVLELRLPVEARMDALDIGDQRRRIAVAARRDVDLEVDAADALDRRAPLAHRGAAAIAAVEGRADAARTQMRERGRMRGDEVADMDVVALAGAVGRRILGAVDVELGALAERGFARDLDEVRRAVGRDRRGRLVLAHGHVLGIAVDGGRRGKDELLDAALDGDVDQVAGVQC